MPKRTGKINAGERDQIALMKAKGTGIRAIARKLGRSPSSISEELRRNAFGEYYVAIHAQAKAKKRKKEAGKRTPLKNAFVYEYVRDKLRLGWSPEQISGRLKLQYPKDKRKQIHWESIYRYIYEEENTPKQLWDTCQGNKKRERKSTGGKHNGVEYQTE